MAELGPGDSMPRLLTVKEAADHPLLVDAATAARLCGIGKTTWWGLHSAGRTPLPVRLGRRTLWRRDELAAWCAAGCPGRDRWAAVKGGRA